MSFTWTDTEQIARALRETYPETDPFNQSDDRLREMVATMDGFTGDTGAAMPMELERIREAWNTVLHHPGEKLQP